MTQLLTLFARREQTTDPVCKAYLPKAQLKTATDIQLYDDRSCTRPAARYSYGTTRPSRSRRTVMHNCFRYKLEWVPDNLPHQTDRYRLLFSSDKRFNAPRGSTQ